MPIERTIAILRPLAATMAAARETGVLHGALHPRDVYLPEDHDGLAGVTGFGIVQALEEAGVHNPSLRRPYVAPERATGTWDARADVFSLGAIAHELLTGRRPAPSGEQDGVFAKEMPPEHRVQLRKVLTTALADQPEQRFASSEALVTALEEAGRRPLAVVSSTAPAAAAPTELVDGHGAVEPQESVGESPFPSETSSDGENDQSRDIPAAVGTPASAAGAVEPAAAPIVEEKQEEAPSLLVVLPAAARADSWIDAALASPSYEVPEAVFDPAPTPTRKPSRSSVVLKTVAYAAAGLVIGTGGGLWVAQRWFEAPVQESQVPPNIAAKSAVRSEPPAPVPPPVSTEVPPVAVAQPEADATEEPRAPSRSVPDVRPAVVAGRLLVRSRPTGALVTIDGRHLGETPVVARGLAPGTYAVRVAHPGHVPRTEKVTIRAAPAVRTLDVTLAPGLETLLAASATSTRGAIDVDSRPRGARVIVDGRFVGLSPLRLADIGPGEHQVTLEMGGYRSATGRVRVDAGRTAQLTTTLRSIE
jgi:hypothetical protein